MKDARCLVILDTMWGEGGRAPRWFAISPYNHSGKRLYYLTGLRFPQVWVANSCREQMTASHQHGKPDPKWLAECLTILPGNIKKLPLLVCGAVAQKTYKACGYNYEGPVEFLPHPAARLWTKELLEETKQRLETLLL